MKWRHSGLTIEQKEKAGWPPEMAAAEEVALAHSRGDVISELKALRDLRDLIEDETSEAVWLARNEGVSWGAIGHCLGVSAQSAYEKYRQKAPADGLWPPDKTTQIWKMNVTEAHRAICEQELKFGTDKILTVNPGDVLLLQVTRQTQKDREARITSALIFQGWERDHEGHSKRLWGKLYRFILNASKCIKTTPFSLESIPGLTGTYSKRGQMNHQLILREDIEAVASAAGISGWMVGEPTRHD